MLWLQTSPQLDHRYLFTYCHQITALWTQLATDLGHWFCIPAREVGFEVRQLGDSRPDGVRRCAQNSTGDVTTEDQHTASAGMADLNILKSWSISESPWKIGFFITISAKMQAMLQTSMGQA